MVDIYTIESEPAIAPQGNVTSVTAYIEAAQLPARREAAWPLPPRQGLRNGPEPSLPVANRGDAAMGLIRGGLAAWQQRVVALYIDDHVGERISLASLGKLVRLSPWHFCRAFKKSFGVPPHRYHNNRRIERAKVLLRERATSVTEIGLALGFSETSAFSAAFRRTAGVTPTVYRRSVG